MTTTTTTPTRRNRFFVYITKRITLSSSPTVRRPKAYLANVDMYLGFSFVGLFSCFPLTVTFYKYIYIYVSKCSLYTFYNNPAPVIRSMQFHYCTVSNPGTGADDASQKRCVLRNATWPSHSRPAIAAGARHFQICFLA